MTKQNENENVVLTIPEKRTHENNYTPYSFRIRNDLKEFLNKVCKWRGSRTHQANHMILLWKAVYDEDEQRLDEMISLIKEYKKNDDSYTREMERKLQTRLRNGRKYC